MQNKSFQKNKVSICRKNSCIHAYGKSADAIGEVVSTMIVVIGIATAIKVLTN